MKSLSVVRGSVAAFSFVSAVVVGCSSDSTTVISDTRAQSLEDLPNCTENRDGETAVLAENDATYMCKKGKWTLVSMPTPTVETLDDLLNCTKKIQGDTVKVVVESAIYRCDEEEWVKFRVLTDTLKSAEDLRACVKKREGNLTYISEEHALYTCQNESWIKTISYMDTVSSQNDLPNCTSKIADDSSYVKKEKAVYLCVEDKWRYLGTVAENAESLSNCTEKHDAEQAFVLEDHEALICSNGKWRKYDVYNVVNQETVMSSSSAKQDDKTASSSSKKIESSSSNEIAIVIPSQRDPNITLSSELIGDGLLTNSRLSGDEMRFKGRFGLDITKDSSENDINITFTNIEYKVLDAESKNVAVNIISNPIVFPTPSDIDLNAMYSAGVKVDMTDAGFTACGNYKLMVTVTATNGVHDYMSTVLIPFEREAAEFCREPYSSSSVAQSIEIPMTYCEVELSTNVNSGVNLATCTAAPASDESADIIFSKAKMNGNSEITAITINGTKIGRINNGDNPPYDDDYEVNMWPENMNAGRNPACAYVSDFKFVEPDPGTTILSMVENFNQIYVALAPGYSTETGVGFYAFAIVDAAEGNNGDYTFKVKIYKVP